MPFKYVFTPMKNRVGHQCLGESFKRYQLDRSSMPPPPLKRMRYDWEPTTPHLFSFPVDDLDLIPSSIPTTPTPLNDLSEINFDVFDYLNDFDWDDITRAVGPPPPLPQE